MNSILKAFVPSFLRKKLRSSVYSSIRLQREAVLNAIPKFQLEHKHIGNLKPLPSRTELLKHMRKHAVVAELGVDKGEFSTQILSITQPAKLHLIDVWGTERYHLGLQLSVEARFASNISANTVEINKGFSTEVVKDFADNYFDWIYIDTDHSYATTKEELEKYGPKMKPSGVIAGHDFAMGNWRNGIKYGVIEAVYEFCVKNDWELIYLTMENGSPSFAIRRIGSTL